MGCLAFHHLMESFLNHLCTPKALQPWRKRCCGLSMTHPTCWKNLSFTFPLCQESTLSLWNHMTCGLCNGRDTVQCYCIDSELLFFPQLVRSKLVKRSLLGLKHKMPLSQLYSDLQQEYQQSESPLGSPATPRVCLLAMWSIKLYYYVCLAMWFSVDFCLA